MKTRRIAAVVALSFLPHAIALPAWAQPGDDPVTVQARARFKEGVDAFDKGQYENARLAFLQAYALKKHPAVLLNLAQSSAKSNHALEASKYFQQYLREATTATAQQKQDAEKGLEEVRQKLGRIEIIAPAGTEVTLDDKDKLGTAPFNDAIDVEPGGHSLKSSTETVRVTANAGQRVQAKFGQAAAPPVIAPVPTSTSPTNEPPPSNQQPPGADQSPTKKYGALSAPENMTPFYIGLAVGGAGLVSAIIFAAFKADSQSKADSVASDIRTAAAKRTPPLNPSGLCNSSDPTVKKDFGGACATLRDNNAKVDTNAAIANVSLGIMAAGFLFAGIWYLAAPKKKEGAQAADDKYKTTLSPYGGFGGESGLSLSGSF